MCKCVVSFLCFAFCMLMFSCACIPCCLIVLVFQVFYSACISSCFMVLAFQVVSWCLYFKFIQAVLVFLSWLTKSWEVNFDDGKSVCAFIVFFSYDG